MPTKPMLILARLLFGLFLLTVGSQAFAAECSGDLRKAAVFTQTNLDGINTNRAVAYYRNADGTICEAGRWATGGAGSVAAIMLGGKNSVLLSGNCLLVTNGGPSSVLDLNGSVSSFRIEQDQLVLAGQVSSRGLIPISVTVRGSSGYVLNELSNSINGFTIDPASCAITERPNSRRSLSEPVIGALGHPAQVQYTPDGRFLIVTNRVRIGVNLLRPTPIHTLAVNGDGLAVSDLTSVSDGLAPFGFDFDAAGHLLVANAGAPFRSLSSAVAYNVNSNGTLSVIGDGRVENGETGGCWLSYTRHTNQPTIYVMSLNHAVISSYTVGEDGSLTLLDADAARTNRVVQLDGLDIDLSEVGPDDSAQYLYGINITPVGFGNIVTWRVEKDGALTRVGPRTPGPQIGFFGLAAR